MVLSKQVSYRYHNKRKSPINGLFTPFMKLCLLFKLLGGKIYLAVSWYTFVHFILHIHPILHFCVLHLKFLEPKMEPTIISSFLCHPVVFANYLILSKFLDKYILLNLTICLIVLTHYLHIAQHNYPNHIFQNT